MLMQISFKNLKVINWGVPRERLRKMRKIKNQNKFVLFPSFYVNMTPVRKHVLSFKYVLCIVLYFLCQVKIRTQKRDFNITLVNRRPMGK